MEMLVASQNRPGACFTKVDTFFTFGRGGGGDTFFTFSTFFAVLSSNKVKKSEKSGYFFALFVPFALFVLFLHFVTFCTVLVIPVPSCHARPTALSRFSRVRPKAKKCRPLTPPGRRKGHFFTFVYFFAILSSNKVKK